MNKSRSRSTSGTGMPWIPFLRKYASVLLPITATLVLTIIYLNAMESHKTELSFAELSSLERQTSGVGNTSVYAIKVGDGSDVLYGLTRTDWISASTGIGFVGWGYGELNGDVWEKIGKSISNVLNGYGIVLFECGCVIRNEMMKKTGIRFGGGECVMLPGFIIEKMDVRFVKLGIECDEREREKMLGGEWYKEWMWKLEEARNEFSRVRNEMMSEDGNQSSLGHV